jgi:hypothetical protein
VHVFAAVMFTLVALVAWWMVLEEGSTPARLLAAGASTVAALVELLPWRRRLLRRSPQGTNEQDS